jgi:SAM-dependent methyltransferase
MYSSGHYELARTDAGSNSLKFRRLMECILREFHLANRPAPCSVLDIGCFNGGFLDVAQAAGLQTYGCDTMVEAVESMAGRHRVWCGTVSDCPFAGETFDLITMNDVIEHLPSPHEYLGFVAKRLRDDGLFVLTTPDAGSWFGRIVGVRSGLLDGIEHLVIYNRGALAFALDRAGLQLVRTRALWKSVSLSYAVGIAIRWQFKRAKPVVVVPGALGRLPVRIFAGEVIAVVQRAGCEDSPGGDDAPRSRSPGSRPIPRGEDIPA